MPSEHKATFMGSMYTFRFRNKEYTAETYFSYDEEPCFIFVTFSDDDLILEFGEDISIATDCNQLLSGNGDYRELIQLKQALFNVIKDGEEFREIKRYYIDIVKSSRVQRGLLN